jgi:hypothetical protein
MLTFLELEFGQPKSRRLYVLETEFYKIADSTEVSKIKHYIYIRPRHKGV